MKTFHIRLLALLALMVVLGAAGTALAAEDSSGKFKQALADNETFFVIQNGEEHTYKLAKDAAILIDNRLAMLGDLREGDNVTVTWELRDGHKRASRVACTRS